MNLEITDSVFIILSVLFLLYLLLLITNSNIGNIKYAIILLFLSYFSSISFISEYIFSNNYLNSILLMSRNLITFYFWINILFYLREDFKFITFYWLILICKIILTIIIYFNEFGKPTEIVFQSISLSKQILGHFLNYIFIILSILELNNGFQSEKIRKNKSLQLKIFTIFLIFFHFLSIMIFLNTILGKYELFIIHHISSFLVLLGLIIFLIITLKLEKVVIQNKKYQYSKDVGKNDLLVNELMKLIVENQIYKDPKISPHKIAILLKTNVNILRQLIQIKIGSSSFFDFINEYRLIKAKEILENNKGKDFNIERVAFDVGFNSYSTFFRNFKKKYKINPTDFYKN